LSFEFNLPNFQVDTPSERRMYAYLYQTVQQLNWAMKHIQPSSQGTVLQGGNPSSGVGGEKAQKFSGEDIREIKSLIIKSAEIANGIYASGNTNCALAVVPVGSGNDFVKSLDIPPERFRNIKGLLDGDIVEVDILLATDDEKRKMCEIVINGGAEYIKTSTGFSSNGATLHDARLMVEECQGRIKVKAAGGIKTIEDAVNYLDIGVSRLGTSSLFKLFC
jgi:hypothetical protein